MPHAPPFSLSTPLREVRGIGPERSAQLERLELRTVEDLLLHRPRRYEDRRQFRPIADLKEGESATARGTVVAAGIKRWKKGTRALFECILEDGSSRLHLRWWQAYPWMEEHFSVGRQFLVFGKVVSVRPRTIDHPETEVIETGEENLIHLNRIVPIHPLTEGLPQRWLRALIWRLLPQCEPLLHEPHPGLALAGMPTRAEAIRALHFPKETPEAEIARERLALDEFTDLQLAIQTRRRKLQTNARALPCGGDNRFMRPFLAQLGFKLTGAQTRVLREIRQDMAGQQPMRRLLQGDVGAGKTAVAACTALMALESGFNVALMAPTEILAEQHYANFRRWFKPLGLSVELQTGSKKTLLDARSSMRDPSNLHPASGIEDRESRIQHPASLFLGTHALIERGFAVDQLGLVIIDEQHKFGVAQRERLVRKGRYPHLLVMTATPIPRTLGLTLYGDLDISIIDQLPAGRGCVHTFVRAADKLPKVWDFVRGKLAEGRQAYVVYPRVEDTDLRTGLKAVTTEHERIQATLAPYGVGLLHGRLKAAEKDRVMNSFRRNELQVLLATAVIEVGLDVPNATVMVVENAEQFGLAQLHQLRGRIGRGAHDSHCILVAKLNTEDARRRLQVLEETTDGFRIADADLALRGPGELLGREQSGLPSFRFGDLARDRELIDRARVTAAQLLGGT